MRQNFYSLTPASQASKRAGSIKIEAEHCTEIIPGNLCCVYPVLCNFSGSAACFFPPFLVCEICGNSSKEQFCLPSQTTSVNRDHPGAGNWRFSVIFPSGFLRTDRSWVCFNMSPRVLDRTFKVSSSPNPSSNVPPPSLGSYRAKARPRAGSAGSLPRLPSAPGLRHGQELQVLLAGSSTSQAEVSVPGAAGLRQPGCPRAHVGRRWVT